MNKILITITLILLSLPGFSQNTRAFSQVDWPNPDTLIVTYSSGSAVYVTMVGNKTQGKLDSLVQMIARSVNKQEVLDYRELAKEAITKLQQAVEIMDRKDQEIERLKLLIPSPQNPSNIIVKD